MSLSATKRPADDTPESSSFISPKKSRSSERALQGIRILLIDAKLDAASSAELRSLAEQHSDGVVVDDAEADIVITAIRMRARLERHISWTLAKHKAIVTPQWLWDSIAHGAPLKCEDYSALIELRNTTAANCPDCGCDGHQTGDEDEDKAHARQNRRSRKRVKRERQQCGSCWCSCVRESELTDEKLSTPPISPSDSDVVIISPPRTPSLTCSKACSSVDTPPDTPKKNSQSQIPIPANLLPPTSPYQTDFTKLSPFAPYACQRASPLKCPNQSLVEALDVIRRSRNLEGESRSELSYMRAIGVLKAQPDKIKSHTEIANLPFIGPKVARLIRAFLETGTIPETESTLSSTRYKALAELSTIYGIGPVTARLLYGRGVRSIVDLCRWYDVDPDDTKPIAGIEAIRSEESAHRVIEITGRAASGRGEDGKEGLIRASLGFRRDLEVKIPREEVEEIGALVQSRLDAVQPGCVSTICGGYRRGKPESNDVDVIISHPNEGAMEDLCKRIVAKMMDEGLLTYVIHYAHARTKLDPREHHFDALEKALAIFVLPPTSFFAKAQSIEYGRPLRRRLDLVFALPQQYWTAVVGWSGSTMFQRDLRWWAKHEREMKFDSAGITRRRDTKIYHPRSEEEVFTTLGLNYIAPEWRNADA